MPEELKCPFCDKVLEEIKEEYHSIGTYVYDTSKDQFKLGDRKKDISESYAIICPYCDAPLPSSLQYVIEKRLPRV